MKWKFRLLLLLWWTLVILGTVLCVMQLLIGQGSFCMENMFEDTNYCIFQTPSFFAAFKFKFFKCLQKQQKWYCMHICICLCAWHMWQTPTHSDTLLSLDPYELASLTDWHYGKIPSTNVHCDWYFQFRNLELNWMRQHHDSI